MSPTDPILSAIQTLEHNLVERLTSEMDRRFSDFRVEVNGRFDAIEKRLDHLEIEYQMMVSGLKRIEERLESDAADRSRLRAEVGRLRSKVADLDSRIQEIETHLTDE